MRLLVRAEEVGGDTWYGSLWLSLEPDDIKRLLKQRELL